MASSEAPSLGRFIRSQRETVGMSLRSLARQLAIAPSYLSDVETDRRVPSVHVLNGIASILMLPPTALLERAGRVDVPALLDEVRCLREQNARLLAALEGERAARAASPTAGVQQPEGVE